MKLEECSVRRRRRCKRRAREFEAENKLGRKQRHVVTPLLLAKLFIPYLFGTHKLRWDP